MSIAVKIAYLPLIRYVVLSFVLCYNFNVNMIKLESYIRGGANSAAQFFMTVEGNPHERPLQLALEELGFFTSKVNVLGVYPADPKRYR